MPNLKKGSAGSEGDLNQPGTPAAPATTPDKFVVGEKEYSMQDIEAMINNEATVTQKSQELSDVLTTIERYGTDPATFLQQAEGAFGVMSDLISNGIIDEQGKVIEKSNPKPPTPPPGTPPVPPRSSNSAVDKDALKSMLNEIMEEKISPLSKALGEIDKTQTNMIRATLGREIKDKYKNLDDKDVSSIFANAMKDGSRDLYAHAEAVAAEKEEMIGALKAQFAKEMGIDLNELNQNAIWEQGPEGGAAVVYKGKKFSFKGGKESVSPREAMEEYFRHLRK